MGAADGHKWTFSREQACRRPSYKKAPAALTGFSDPGGYKGRGRGPKLGGHEMDPRPALRCFAADGRLQFRFGRLALATFLAGAFDAVNEPSACADAIDARAERE